MLAKTLNIRLSLQSIITMPEDDVHNMLEVDNSSGAQITKPGIFKLPMDIRSQLNWNVKFPKFNINYLNLPKLNFMLINA